MERETCSGWLLLNYLSSTVNSLWWLGTKEWKEIMKCFDYFRKDLHGSTALHVCMNKMSENGSAFHWCRRRSHCKYKFTDAKRTLISSMNTLLTSIYNALYVHILVRVVPHCITTPHILQILFPIVLWYSTANEVYRNSIPSDTNLRKTCCILYFLLFYTVLHIKTVNRCSTANMIPITKQGSPNRMGISTSTGDKNLVTY